MRTKFVSIEKYHEREQQREEQEQDRARKQAKVKRLVTRAAACRSFEGLEKVADDARSAGLWHAGNGAIIKAVSRCNARLRGRHVPSRWVKGDNELVVSDDRVIKMPWIRSRTVSEEGYRYAGQAD
jgi:hypothetical protein